MNRKEQIKKFNELDSKIKELTEERKKLKRDIGPIGLNIPEWLIKKISECAIDKKYIYTSVLYDKLISDNIPFKRNTMEYYFRNMITQGLIIRKQSGCYIITEEYWKEQNG